MRGAEPIARRRAVPPSMHTRVVKPKRGPEMLVRPLRQGDVDTVRAVFARLGSRVAAHAVPRPEAGAQRGGAAVARERRARPPRARGLGRRRSRSRSRSRVSCASGGGSAEIAFEVADAYQGRGIGSALAQLLVADARAAGICELTALVRSDNRAALALLRRVLGRLELRMEGPDMFVRALLPGCS